LNSHVSDPAPCKSPELEVKKGKTAADMYEDVDSSVSAVHEDDEQECSVVEVAIPVPVSSLNVSSQCGKPMLKKLQAPEPEVKLTQLLSIESPLD